MPEVKAVTYNHDIHGLIRRLDRFIYELLHCVSGNQSLTNEFDQTRLISYIKAIRTYHDWVIAQPALDLPETSPRGMAVEAPLSIPKIENDDVMDILNLMDIARLELLNSQSSRLACNMMTYDSKRLLAVVSKVEAFLLTYIKPISPIDLPESTPLNPMVGAGRTGV